MAKLGLQRASSNSEYDSEEGDDDSIGTAKTSRYGCSKAKIKAGCVIILSMAIWYSVDARRAHHLLHGKYVRGATAVEEPTPPLVETIESKAKQSNALVVEQCFNSTGGNYIDGGNRPLYHNSDAWQTSCDVIVEGSGINTSRPWVDWRWTVPSTDTKCRSELNELYSMTQADMCNVSKGLSFLFVGDSLTFQMYSSFSLMLGEQRPEAQHRAATQTNLHMLSPLCNETVLASYIPSDFLSNSANQSVPESWRSFSKSFDVLVLNRGIHMGQ
eukprot:CAMPEP_0171682488 /NCGR_PEP_ID=MMETSP0991-20121206/559_1 /TAXON_ID=483369 /ORGANISM="non described non described, Strain CCMP2098" /LENGTH=271 /DNA_ID=CAMNT_0012269707 /DNA_START=3 /DNA_END=815 /DNA_ORIENTATION=+